MDQLRKKDIVHVPNIVPLVGESNSGMVGAVVSTKRFHVSLRDQVLPTASYAEILR